MKLNPESLTKAREWAKAHGVHAFFAIVGLFALMVLLVNVRAHFGRAVKATGNPVAVAAATAIPAATQKPVPAVAPARAPASAAIPHIAQRPVANGTAAAAIATPAAPPPIAAPIQPPAGIQPGFMLQKNYRQAQFGLAQTSAEVVSVQTLSVQAQATGGDGERATEWSAWFNLAKPTTIAWVRTAAGEGTIAVTIDGMRLGDPVDHWPMSGPLSNLATVPLTAGWHQITIHDTRRGWVKGPGVAARVDLGDGTGATVSPQPWAIPLGARPAAAASAVPHNAQQRADAPGPASTASAAQSPRHESHISRNTPAAKPAAPGTTGGAP